MSASGLPTPPAADVIGLLQIIDFGIKSERKTWGLYPLWERLPVVWAVSTLHSPLRPAAASVEGWQGRGTECLHSMPVPGPAQLLPTGTRCTHVRAGLLLLRAEVGPTPTRCSLPPLLPAAHAPGMRAAPPCARRPVRSCEAQKNNELNVN